jgi:hypothetical protein
MENTQEYFGLKELNSVVIRAYTDLQIGNKHFEAGEPILYFEKIQISQLSSGVKIKTARGGWGNYPHVIWEDFNDLQFRLTEGVLSRNSLGLLMNSGAFHIEAGEEKLKVPKREKLTVSNNQVKTMFAPLSEKLFIYAIDDNGYIGEKITDFTIDNTIITFANHNNCDIVIDYYFEYTNSFTQYNIGNKHIDGFLTLEGKAYMKDDVDGLNRTFLFEMPKIKITSNIDIVIGEKASPTVSVFNILGAPIKENNQFVVCKMSLLNDDIDSEI